TPAPPTPDANGNATCTSGTYTSSINYDTVGTNGPINLTLQSGVIVNLPAGGNAVNAANTTGVTLGSANITIAADGVIINNAANPAVITTPGCEYSLAAPPPLRPRTQQLRWPAPRATGRYWRSQCQT